MCLSGVVEPSPPRQQLRTIEGQIKLSIQYKQRNAQRHGHARQRSRKY